MKPERHTWIDYARGIAIILVLYRHVFEGIKNAGISIAEYLPIEHANIMFFSFRMPLFFIISGVFVIGSLKKRGLNNFISTKARIILYPYFLWGILQITLQILLSNYVNANRSLYSYLELFYMPRTIDQFWYLYALFNVSVIYVLVAHFLKLKFGYNILIGFAFFFLSILAYQSKINLGFLGDILHYYLFFAIGDAIGNIIRNKENKKHFESWKMLLMLFIPFIATQYYYLRTNLPYAAMNYEFVEFYQPVVFIGIALMGGAFVIYFSFFLQKFNLISWLHILGRHSLYIYVAHVMVLASVRIFMTKVLGIYNVPLLFIAGIVMGLVIPIFLYKLAVKLNMQWLFTLESNKEYSQYVKA
ncbi:MAG TPA: acyltransferase [Ferruginibacter sp.]|nr:acyltransferase [Ferruginibacter sp.]